MNNWNIRFLEQKDIPQCVGIMKQNYPTAHKYHKRISIELTAMFVDTTNPPQYFVIEKEQKVIGFAGFSQSWMDYDVYEVYWVNIDPQYQRHGLGSVLINRIIEEVCNRNGARILLTTTSPAFYEQFGFTVFEKMPGEYSLMMLRL